MGEERAHVGAAALVGRDHELAAVLHQLRSLMVTGLPGLVTITGLPGAGRSTLAATAVAGPVAFVGLVVPHAARILVGPAHVRLLPLSALLGALVLLLADVVGRVVVRPVVTALTATASLGSAASLISAPPRRSSCT